MSDTLRLMRSPLPGVIKAPANEGPRMLYDRKEAARQISVSIRALDYLIAGKKLETRRIGKKVLVTHASLIRFSAANHYETVTAA